LPVAVGRESSDRADTLGRDCSMLTMLARRFRRRSSTRLAALCARSPSACSKNSHSSMVLASVASVSSSFVEVVDYGRGMSWFRRADVTSDTRRLVSGECLLSRDGKCTNLSDITSAGGPASTLLHGVRMPPPAEDVAGRRQLLRWCAQKRTVFPLPKAERMGRQGARGSPSSTSFKPGRSLRRRGERAPNSLMWQRESRFKRQQRVGNELPEQHVGYTAGSRDRKEDVGPRASGRVRGPSRPSTHARTIPIPGSCQQRLKLNISAARHYTLGNRASMLCQRSTDVKREMASVGTSGTATDRHRFQNRSPASALSAVWQRLNRLAHPPAPWLPACSAG